MRGMRRALRGSAALITLIALVAGLPVALYRLGGNPLPGHIPSWHHVTALLLHRDNGSVFLGAVRDLSWLAWAAFTVAAAIEAQAALRGRRAPRLRLGGLQNAAGWLVTLAALAFSSQPAVALASTPPASAVTVGASSRARRPGGQLPGRGGHTRFSVRQRSASRAGDEHGLLPDGDRPAAAIASGRSLSATSATGISFREILKLNLGHDMGGGQMFTDPSVIWTGWVLQLPASPTAAPSQAAPATPADTSAHSGHASADPPYSSPHPGAQGTAAGAGRATHPAAGQPSVPAQAGQPPSAGQPSAPAPSGAPPSAASPATASHPAAEAEIPPASCSARVYWSAA